MPEASPFFNALPAFTLRLLTLSLAHGCSTGRLSVSHLVAFGPSTLTRQLALGEPGLSRRPQPRDPDAGPQSRNLPGFLPPGTRDEERMPRLKVSSHHRVRELRVELSPEHYSLNYSDFGSRRGGFQAHGVPFIEATQICSTYCRPAVAHRPLRQNGSGSRHQAAQPPLPQAPHYGSQG